MNSSSRVQTSFTGLPACGPGEPPRRPPRRCACRRSRRRCRARSRGRHRSESPNARGELAAHAEGALRSGPDGELPVFPLRHGRAGLERRMGDVGDRVSLLEMDIAGLPILHDRAGSPGRRRRARRRARRPCRLQLSKRSLPESGGPGFHSALIAARARDGLAICWARRRRRNRRRGRRPRPASTWPRRGRPMPASHRTTGGAAPCRSSMPGQPDVRGVLMACR